ncbi:hypothetical protein VNI00_017647 [Paramarasmius palmivorus]|uniref:Uncharacterized protein n=1 Tax=Paramarasmius palmivorus TaxID=297713 RepID=A0AAW0B3V7_9AGAR
MWSGLNASQDVRTAIKHSLKAKQIIPNLVPVPYNEKETKITDGRYHIVIFRSFITNKIKTMMKDIVEEARCFMADTTPPTALESSHNLRGDHWFCIAGYDRNNKAAPRMSKWHAKQTNKVKPYFNKKWPFAVLTRIGCSLVQKYFPRVYERYRRCSDYMLANKGFEAPYGGIFFNFCLNGAREGVDRVFCDPHVDFKNVALGVCMVFVYGHFDHWERCWLVIWEAGVVLELPPGVFIIYPSSLFLHFNIDRAQFLVTDGDHPSHANSRPLCSCGDGGANHGTGWQEARGRGSIVWFNQATMLQTSELGFATVKDAKAAGVDTNCNMSADNVFEPLVLCDFSAAAQELELEDSVEPLDTVDDFW